MTERGRELQKHYERYREIIQRLTLMSDAFMRNVFKKPECLEYILRIILQKKDLRVTEVVIQQDYKNLQGRSVILDCLAEDEDGHRYDVEVQQEKEGALPKRARYHCGLMDMNTLDMGADFEALPESYVIFITAGDPFGERLPIYHIDRIIEETGNPFQDQSHIIYVNSDIRGDTALGRLMHDFHCQRADEMYSQVLAERVRELKETQEGVDHMCQEMEKIYREGRKEGREEGKEEGRKAGRLEGKRETAINLAEMGMPVDRIAQAVKVNIQLVREWLSGNTGIAR